MAIAAVCSPDQLQTGSDVSPLVASADLKRDSITTKELAIIVRLKQHVREFGVGDTGLHSHLNGFLGEHVVQREVLADFTHEFHCAEWKKPVGVVAHLRCASSREIEKFLELA